MKKIVVFGSINTDLTINTPYIPTSGETLKGNDFRITHGGKGANQAVAASRLGAEVQMIGCIGNDTFGKDALISLKNDKVGTTYIRVIDDIPSAIAIIIRVNNDNRIILDSAANEFLRAEDLNTYMLKHVATNSIFLAQLENNPEEVYKALKIAKKAKMITIFNPAPAIPLPDTVYEIIDYLVINQTEAKILSGIYPLTLEDTKSVYKKLRDKGLNNLIITLGILGSVILTNSEVEKIDSVEVQAVDSTGAGDAYIGAMAMCLANDKTLVESCKFASYVSALSVTKKGAQDSLPTLDEVNCFIRSKENGY